MSIWELFFDFRVLLLISSLIGVRVHVRVTGSVSTGVKRSRRSVPAVDVMVPVRELILRNREILR